MVFDEPPAPAARVEFGFETVLPVARRRTAAPGGLATAEAERPTREDLGESESDMVCFAGVVVLSLSFIASIFFLHISAKIIKSFTK